MLNFYRLAFWLSVSSLILLAVILFSPAEYMVLKWEKSIFTAGILLPFLLISWICALAALALNFIYAERLFIIHQKVMRKRKKFFPAILCLPAVISFLWFCYKFYKGFHGEG